MQVLNSTTQSGLVNNDVFKGRIISTNPKAITQPLRKELSIHEVSSLLKGLETDCIAIVDSKFRLLSQNNESIKGFINAFGFKWKVGDIISMNDSRDLSIVSFWNNLFKSLKSKSNVENEIQINNQTWSISLKSVSISDYTVVYVLRARELSIDKSLKKQQDLLVERWKIAAEGNAYAMWDWDIKENELYYSASCYKLLGYDEFEMSEGGMEKWSTRIHPDDLALCGRHLLDILHCNADTFKVEYRIKTKSGDYIWVEDQGKAHGDDGFGAPTHIIGLMKDISVRKRIFFENDQYLKQLEKFAFLTSHELRLPVANVLGLIELISLDDEQNLKKIAGYLKESAKMLDGVIKTMSDTLTKK